MNSDPLVSARMREIQNSAAARRKKREDAAEELDRRKAKAEAERWQQVSPRDVEAQEKIDALMAKSTAEYERQREIDAAKRHRVWFDQMQSCKTEFYDPTTSPFRRGQCVILYAETNRHVNGTPLLLRKSSICGKVSAGKKNSERFKPN